MVTKRTNYRFDEHAVARFLSGEMEATERKDFVIWMNSNKKHHHLVDHTERIWITAANLSSFDQIKPDDAWTDIRLRLKPRYSNRYKSIPLTRITLRVTAVVAGAALLAFGLYFLTSHFVPKGTEMLATGPVPATFLLPDGTEVTLNKQSKLIYSTDFKRNNRSVVLEGEAFFRVAESQLHPFLVSTDKAEVKVLGTIFNLREGVDGTQVSVFSGVVHFSQIHKSESIVKLTSRQSATLTAGSGEIAVDTFFNPNVVAWKTGTLLFDRAPLISALQVIANLHDKELKVAGRVSDSISGSFNLIPLNELLNELEHISRAKIDTDAYRIIVRN